MPEKPGPFFVELHAPFPAPYVATGSTNDGYLIVGRPGVIGIFDGLHWRKIDIGEVTPAAFLQKGSRIWIASNGELGWIDADGGNTKYHVAVTGLQGPFCWIADAGEDFFAITSDAVLRLDASGKVLSKRPVTTQPVRWHFRWRNGWIVRSMIDAFYLSDNGIITDDTGIPLDILTGHAIVSAINATNDCLLIGQDAAYHYNNGKCIASTEYEWRSLCRHLICCETFPSDQTIIRVAGDGLDGFSLDMHDWYWHAPVGERIAGNLGCYPAQTRWGLVIATTAKVYWIPPPSQVRTLTNDHQVTLGLDADETGFWVGTSEGSWHIANGAWHPQNSLIGATFTVRNTKLGLIRGQLPIANVGGRFEINSGTGGQVKAICELSDGIALVQGGTISEWALNCEMRERTNIPDYCTSAATVQGDGILIGTDHSGTFIWHHNQPLEHSEIRGHLVSTVCSIRNTPVVLWADGVLEIGGQKYHLPTQPKAKWEAITTNGENIILGGQWGQTSALAQASNTADGWQITALDHLGLNAIAEIYYLATSNQRVALAGPGGCLDIALSAFTRATNAPASKITAIYAPKPGGSRRSLDIDAETIELLSRENELQFALKGGPAYWKQRVKFAYRLLPDSAGWTDLDPANEVDIQRIAAGKHTLEIESRSLAGTATSRYTIIRPPYWYASRWAYGAYGLSLMGATAGFFVWRTRRLRVRARILEERVAQRTAELKKANEAKDEFLASMSHEIRNPLNGVIGLSGMLQESAQTERDRRLIESLRACADQLRLVLDDVLDFSVIERGEVQVQLAPFKPAAAIRSAVVAVDAKLERTRVTFGPKFSDGLWIRGDEGKLRQIVSNLVSNAHKYGVPPEAKVDARLHDGRLVVTVSNTGPDIPPDDQARIFESFERGRSAAHKYVRGAGLGLTISSRFARAMGGEITVKSENGLTSFIASIPTAVVEKPTHATSASDAPARGVALAIEDEPYNRLVLGHVLVGLGFEVEWAQNGTEALDILKSGRPYAIIFTDWMLPDMQGGELVRQIKQLRGNTTPPIIAVTAYATAEKRAEAFAAGVSAFVTKPITPEKIEGAVQTNGTGAEIVPPPPTPHDEPLRVGILLDGQDAAQRVTSFRDELTRHMAEIETALRQHDSDRTARTAHRLASQLLAIHHHTFADELRALETAALRYQWDLARDLHANAARAAASLTRQLDDIARSQAAKPSAGAS